MTPFSASDLRILVCQVRKILLACARHVIAASIPFDQITASGTNSNASLNSPFMIHRRALLIPARFLVLAYFFAASAVLNIPWALSAARCELTLLCKVSETNRQWNSAEAFPGLGIDCFLKLCSFDNVIAFGVRACNAASLVDTQIVLIMFCRLQDTVHVENILLIAW